MVVTSHLPLDKKDVKGIINIAESSSFEKEISLIKFVLEYCLYHKKQNQFEYHFDSKNLLEFLELARVQLSTIICSIL